MRKKHNLRQKQRKHTTAHQTVLVRLDLLAHLVMRMLATWQLQDLNAWLFLSWEVIESKQRISIEEELKTKTEPWFQT